ncbi:HAD-IA family hydrolase [Bacillus salitolerans]|uniref:HAD-IA family hydrolase n=1 Tax=Bacillus salitolerans TaxID=1437434 RepID=A0ABW4LV64_9BACI
MFIKVFNILAKKYHFSEIQSKDLNKLKKMTINERCHFLKLSRYKIPLITPELYKLYRQSMSEIKVYENIREMLHQLKNRGYQTAIISSNSEKNILEFLKRNEIDGFTDVFCSSRIFGKDRMLKRFLKRKRLDPSDIIYVGDEHRDIIASKNSGVKSIWVGWGYDSIDAIESVVPDFIVQSPLEILEVI